MCSAMTDVGCHITSYVAQEVVTSGQRVITWLLFFFFLAKPSNIFFSNLFEAFGIILPHRESENGCTLVLQLIVSEESVFSTGNNSTIWFDTEHTIPMKSLDLSEIID